MADFKQGSRFRNGVEGTFRGEAVIFPRDIDYSLLEFAKFHTITAGQEFRPDLISRAVYIRDDLGWFLMAANQIDSVEDLTAGRTIGVVSIVGIII